jgi:hypothetical protein
LLAAGLLNAIACRVATDTQPLGGTESSLLCPDTSSAAIALGVIGVVVGFWFTWTGRLARLFRRV